MNDAEMREPWLGDNYDANRLLLLGESAYSWWEGDQLVEPSTRHAIELVQEAIDGFPTNRFMNMLSRGVTGEEWPVLASLKTGWAKVAFTNYVPSSVGGGARVRPTTDMWQEAIQEFPSLLEKLRPRNIIVLGKTMWGLMPKTDVYLTDDVQAYRLIAGEPVMCWAVNHPSAGLGWERLSALVRFVLQHKI